MSSMADLLHTMEILIETRQPGLIWGDVGFGKTAALRALVERSMHGALVVYALPTKTNEDQTGLPYLVGEGEETTTAVSIPALASAIEAAVKRQTELQEKGLDRPDLSKKKGPVVVWLDELNNCGSDIQRTMLTVIQDREICDYQLPECVTFMAAANPEWAVETVVPLMSSIANRFCHLDFDEAWDIEDFASSLMSTVPTRLGPMWKTEDHVPLTFEPDWWDEGGEGKEMVDHLALFLRFHAEAIPRPVGQGTGGIESKRLPGERGLSFPTARSCETAAWCLGAAKSAGREDLGWSIVEGWCGTEFRSAFERYMDTAGLPSVEEVLADPLGVEIPSRPDQLGALLYSVVHHVEKNVLVDGVSVGRTKWKGALSFADRIAREGREEIATWCASSLFAASLYRRLEWDVAEICEMMPPSLRSLLG